METNGRRAITPCKNATDAKNYPQLLTRLITWEERQMETNGRREITPCKNTMDEENYPQLLTINEAGKLGIMRPYTIRNLVYEGKIESIKRGNRFYVTESAIRKVMEDIS